MRSTLPRAVRDLTQALIHLPGIGPKTAQRLSIHLLRQPHSVVRQLADTLKNLHVNVRTCVKCYNLAEEELCAICRDEMRRQDILCIVEDPLDIEAIEKTDAYNGLYHVLGGVLSPMEGIGAEQLTVEELRQRLEGKIIKELIVALDPSLEGEATMRYILDHLPHPGIKISRLARGLPTGGDIEFADAVTLSAAFDGRKEIHAR